METLTTILLILASFAVSFFLIYKGVTGVVKNMNESKK
jgi:capsular polysaccharide biosynthesis protein